MPTSSTGGTAGRAAGAERRRPALSLEQDVEHEAAPAARPAGAASPARRSSHRPLARRLDGARAGGRRRSSARRAAADEIDAALLDATWREVADAPRAGIAHRALRAANVLVTGGRPVVIDMGFGEESAGRGCRRSTGPSCWPRSPRSSGRRDARSTSALRVVGPGDAGADAALPPAAGAVGGDAQAGVEVAARGAAHGVADDDGEEPAPLERLVRVRPRTLVMIARSPAPSTSCSRSWPTSTTASRRSARPTGRGSPCRVVMSGSPMSRSRDRAWSAACPSTCRSCPTVEAQLASSFVNRVTPANVGGMALNVRFLQKAGVDRRRR